MTGATNQTNQSVSCYNLSSSLRDLPTGEYMIADYLELTISVSCDVNITGKRGDKFMKSCFGRKNNFPPKI